MASLIFQEVVDKNLTSKIVKEDKTNTDILEIQVKGNTELESGDTVTYKDSGATILFTGIIQGRKIGQGVKLTQIYDNGAQLLNRTTNRVFKNFSPEGIIEEIINTNTTLTYVSTVVSGVIIPTYVANKKRDWDIVTEMSELLLANFTVDKGSNFRLELEGENASIKSLSNANARLDGKWKEDITQLYNSITVDGDDRQIFEREPELFDGTGSPATYTLSEIPVDLKVESPIGTVKKGFVEGASTGDYTLDRENKQFTGTFPVGVANVKSTYTTSIPISVRRRDKSSIDTYGQRDKVFKKPYIKTREEARKFAEFILSRFSTPLLSSTWIITSNTEYNDFENYVPNETISVNDTENGISGTFIIRKVVREYPGLLKITVGQPDDDYIAWGKEVQQRVKQLEEKDDNATILNEDELVVNNLRIKFKVETVSVVRRTFLGDTFYLEENTSGTRNQMLDDGTGPVMREVGYIDTGLFPTSLETEEGGVLLTEDEFGIGWEF